MTRTDAPREPDRQLRLPRAEIVGGALAFDHADDAALALSLGAFLVAVPRGLDLQPGLDLCRGFYRERTDPHDKYRGHLTETHPDSKLGYEDRPDQVEQLQLESAHWDTYLPGAVTALLREMRRLTLAALHGLFELSGIPPADWETITGGASAGTGWCYSTINHYRTDLAGRIGIVRHTDSGFITLFHADQPGLEVLSDSGEWVPVAFDPAYFLVNLGDSLEILTRNLPRPITAVVHRVPELPPGAAGGDRSSFTVYMGPRYDMGIYQYSPDGALRVYQGFREFSVDKARQLGYEFHARI
jgi:hypothetical protein